MIAGFVLLFLLQLVLPGTSGSASTARPPEMLQAQPYGHSRISQHPVAPRASGYPTVEFTAGTPFAGGGYGVAFDAYHSTFDVVGRSGLQVVNEGTWTSGGSISLSLGSYTRIAIDSGRQLGFISGGTAGGLYIFNTTSLAVVKTLATSSTPEGLAVDPGRHLLVYLNGSSVSFFDYQTFAAPVNVAVTANLRVAIDPSDQLVATGGGGLVSIINETTRKWVTNVSVVASNLPVGFDNVSGEVLTGSNLNDGLSLFHIKSSNPVTNLTFPPLTSIQDLCMVGGGSDEALLWGPSDLIVFAINNQSVLQTLSGSASFPYGIAEDPATFTAVGVDPVTASDYPYYGVVVNGGSGPLPPTSAVATRGNGTFTVSWTKSTTPTVSNYSVNYGPSASSLKSIFSTGSGTSSSATIPWSNGVAVYAEVTAWAGAQPSSPTRPIVSTIPGAVPYPAQLLAVQSSNDSLSVSWTAPASDEGFPVLNYSVGVGTSPNSLTWGWSTGGPSTSLQVSGLSDGVLEYVAVRAWNAIGGSHPTLPAQGIPSGVPYPVQGVTVQSYNGTLAVSWSAPSSTDGSPVTNFSLGLGSTPTSLSWTYSTGSGTVRGFGFTGLTDGSTFFVSVRAWNLNGGSAASTPVGSSPKGIPYPVQHVALYSMNGSLLVTWSAPASNDGSAIVNYSIGVGLTPSNLVWQDQTGSGTASSLVVGGLLDGTTYYASVRAWNAIGGGNASTPVSATPCGVPYPVVSVQATAANGSLKVAWGAPVSDGGASITNFSIGVGTSPSSLVWNYSTASGSAHSATIRDLADGVQLYVSVRAWNSVGGGSPSATVSATPLGTPYPVEGVVLIPQNGSLALAWSAPAYDGGTPVLNYSVEIGPSPTSLVPYLSTGSALVTNATLRNLPNGVMVYVVVRAWNSVGVGSASGPRSATPAGVPYPVRGVLLQPSNDTLSVNWSAPLTDDGAPVSSYWVHYSTSPGGIGPTLRSPSPCACLVRLDPLLDGQAYYVSIVAQNSAGNSSALPVHVGIPVGLPYPPQGISAILVSSSTANVSWSPPASFDGSSLTGYILEYSIGGAGTQTISLGPSVVFYDLSGLSAGTTYSFRVLAVNAVGTGNATEWVSLRTPTAGLSPAQVLTSTFGILLLLLITVAAVLLLALLLSRRRRRDHRGGPRPGPGELGGGASSAPLLLPGIASTVSSDDVAPAYGSYPLALPEPEWYEGESEPREAPTARPVEEKPHEFSPFVPYVLTVRPEGIRVEQVTRGGGLTPVRTIPSGAASASAATPAATVEPDHPRAEAEEAAFQEQGETGAEVPGPAGSPASDLEEPPVPPLSGADAYAVLRGLATQPRSLDAVKQSTRLEDDLLLVLMGALVRAKLITRVQGEGGAHGTFALTPAGRSLLQRSLPGSAPATTSPGSVVPATALPAPSPSAQGSRLSELPASHAVLHHLGLFHGHRDEAVVPAEVTQAGIAQALGTTPNSVAVTLKRLEDGGLVRPDLRHVKGARRRLKSYFLTEKGLALRSKLSPPPPPGRGGSN